LQYDEIELLVHLPLNVSQLSERESRERLAYVAQSLPRLRF